MEGLGSSCADLINLLKNSGSPQAELRSLLCGLHEHGILTEFGYHQILACLVNDFASRSSSASDSEELLDGQVSNTFDTKVMLSTHLQPSLEAPTYTSREAKIYKHLHNQAFNVDTCTDQKGLTHRDLKNWKRNAIFPGVVDSAPDNIFLGPVYVALALTPDQPQPDACSLAASLLLDTGSDFNIISLCLAKELGSKLALEGDIKFLANTGGGDMHTRGQLDIRWWYKGGAFGKKFLKSTFHISATKLDVQMIIGWQDLIRLGLVSVNPRPCFVGFNSKPPPVDKSTVADEEAAADERRRAEEVEMKNDASNQNLNTKRTDNAHERALLHLQRFASQYRALHGEVGLQQACDAKYPAIYQMICNAET